MVEKNYTLKKTIIILAPYNQHYSPYLAMSNDPISFVDPTGGEDIEYYTNDLYNWFANFYNNPDFWNTSLSPQFENYDSYQEYLTALKRFGEPERILLAGKEYQTIFVKQQSNAKLSIESWHPEKKYLPRGFLIDVTADYMSTMRDKRLLPSLDLYAQKDGDGDKKKEEKYKAEGDFIGDLMFFGDLYIGGVGKTFGFSANYSDGRNFLSIKAAQNEKIIGSVFKQVVKVTRILGVISSTASLTESTIKYYNIEGKASWGQKGELAIGWIGNSLTMSRNPYALGFGITINVVKYYGGFKNDFQYLDEIEQTNNSYINLGFFLSGQRIRLK